MATWQNLQDALTGPHRTIGAGAKSRVDAWWEREGDGSTPTANDISEFLGNYLEAKVRASERNENIKTADVEPASLSDGA